MSPAAVVVGMCLAISVLVTVLCAWMAHDADQRRVVAEEEAAVLAARLRVVERELAMVNGQLSMVNEAAGGEAVLWTEWSGWTGWLAAQTVVDGRRIRVWFN